MPRLLCAVTADSIQGRSRWRTGTAPWGLPTRCSSSRSSTSTSGATSPCPSPLRARRASTAPTAASRCTSPRRRRYQGRFFHPVYAGAGLGARRRPKARSRGYIEFAVASGGYLVESNLGRFRRALPRRGLDRGRLSRQRRRWRPTRGCWRRRCTASIGPTATCSVAVAARTARSRASRTATTCGTARCPTSTAHSRACRACSRCRRTLFRVLARQAAPDRRRARAGRQRRHVRGAHRRGARRARRRRPGWGSRRGAWFDAERVRLQYTTVWAGLFDHFATWDPTYFDDFWTVPGYLGANPTESLARTPRSQHKTKIAEAGPAPEARRARPADPDGPARARTSTTCPVAYRARGPARRRPHRRDVALHERTGRRPPRVDLRRARRHLTHRDRTGGVRAPPQASRSATTCSSTTRPTSRSRPTTATKCHPDDESPSGTSSAPRGRPDLPTAPAAARPALRAQQRRGPDERTLRRQDDRRPEPLRRDRLSAASGVVPPAGRGGCSATASTTSTASGSPTTRCTRPRGDATHRAATRRATRGSSTTAACSSRRSATSPPGQNAASRRRRARTTSSSTARSYCPATAAARRGIQPVVHAHRERRRTRRRRGRRAGRLLRAVEVPAGAGTIVAAEWDFEGDGDFPVVEPFTNEDLVVHVDDGSTASTRSPRPARTSRPCASPHNGSGKATTRTAAS